MIYRAKDTYHLSRSAQQPGSIQKRNTFPQIHCGEGEDSHPQNGMRRIGPDVGACAWSVGGIVHVYMTTSGGRVSRQMARDLSVNRNEGGGLS